MAREIVEVNFYIFRIFNASTREKEWKVKNCSMCVERRRPDSPRELSSQKKLFN